MVVMTDREFIVRLSMVFSEMFGPRFFAGDVIAKICVGFGFDDKRRADCISMTDEEIKKILKGILEEEKNVRQ
jgi:hypothetical protein